MRLMVLYFKHSCKFPFLWRMITRDLVQSVGHSPVIKILLQTEVWKSTMAILIAITNTAGASSVLVELLPSLLVEKEEALHLVLMGSQVPLDLHLSHSCKGQAHLSFSLGLAFGHINQDFRQYPGLVVV